MLDGWDILFSFLANWLFYLGFVVKIFNTGTRPLVVIFHDDQKPQDDVDTRRRGSATFIFDLVGFGGRGAVREVEI